MSQAHKDLQLADKGEFMRLDPAFIKVESGGLWRDSGRDLEALKASIVWRERRMKGSGLLVPILVSRIPDTDYFQLEDGLRRFKAIQELLAQGIEIDTVPVRVLPAPLSMSERLMLMTHGPKMLTPLEESKIIGRLEKQGLSFEGMSRLMDRPVSVLKKRAILGKLTGAMAKALETGHIKAEEMEMLINPDEKVEVQQARLEKEFKKVISAIVKNIKGRKAPMNLVDALGQKDSQGIPENNKTAWMPKSLDPMLYYVALEGLYEWIGGENAVKHGYSKDVVEIVQLMLKYSGGKLGLQETAEKLKKY